MNLIDIGHVVGARRAELGLTQAQLSHLSGLSRQTLVGLENGTLSDLGVNRVGQVLAVLGLDSTAAGYPVAAQKAWLVDGGQDGQCQLLA
jgi:transcriptional regulator with XRE-family HTH domain